MVTLVFSLVFMVLVVGTLGGWAVREQRRRTPDGPTCAEERRIP
jgi:hypothetical protein